MQVLDYSDGRPGAAAIKAAGYLGAVRYCGFPTRTKCTRAAELQDFTAHGLGMALVYEDSATDWMGGFARGQAAGDRARGHATSVGFPTDRPIYMAVDRDVVTSGEFGVMVEYLRGASTSLGGWPLTGVYGEHDVMVRAQHAGVAAWFWQTRAWSTQIVNGARVVDLFPGRHLYQNAKQATVNGFACDINDVLQADWGQHNANHIHIQEEDMTLTASELKALDDRFTIHRAWTAEQLGKLAAVVSTGKGNALASAANPGWGWLNDNPVSLADLAAAPAPDVDEAAIASAVSAAVIAALPAEVTDQVTAEEVEAAVVAGLGKVHFTPDAN